MNPEELKLALNKIKQLDYDKVRDLNEQLRYSPWSSGSSADSLELAKVLTEISQRLDRIETQLLLIFDTNGQDKNLS